MQIIYVGDTGNLLRRIKTNHCGGNVEGSALRRHVAEALGYTIKCEKKRSGNERKRIDLPNPQQGEKRVSDYIRSGEWRLIILDNCKIANDFQWFVIEKLSPLLNHKRKNYVRTNIALYTSLLQKLKNSPLLEIKHLSTVKSEPGVYIFYHDSNPQDYG